MTTEPTAASTDPSEDVDRSVGDDLLAGVVGASDSVREHVIAGNRTVRDALAAFRRSLDELHDTEDRAWKHYAHEVDRALVHLDAELQVAAAQLRAERAETSADLSIALHEAAHSWRGRLDDARVQSRLAQMEGRDTGRRAVDELSHAGQLVDRTIRDLGGTVNHSLQDSRKAAVGAINKLGEAVRSIHLLPSAPATDIDDDDLEPG